MEKKKKKKKSENYIPFSRVECLHLQAGRTVLFVHLFPKYDSFSRLTRLIYRLVPRASVPLALFTWRATPKTCPKHQENRLSSLGNLVLIDVLFSLPD